MEDHRQCERISSMVDGVMVCDIPDAGEVPIYIRPCRCAGVVLGSELGAGVCVQERKKRLDSAYLSTRPGGKRKWEDMCNFGIGFLACDQCPALGVQRFEALIVVQTCRDASIPIPRKTNPPERSLPFPRLKCMHHGSERFNLLFHFGRR